jgi:hypothetical protein
MEEAVLAHAPPSQPTACALHLKIISTQRSKEELKGEVIIPSFTPFISVASTPPKLHVFPVWSAPEPKTPGGTDFGPRKNIGELRMGIKWSPSRKDLPRDQKAVKGQMDPTNGQLMMVIRGLKFYRSKVPDESYLNPKIQVCTYNEQGKLIDIQRGDPRKLTEKAPILNGPYGGIINYDVTMRTNPLTKGLSRYYSDMGYDEQTQEWQWNQLWGTQNSVRNVQVAKQFVELPQRQNVIDLRGVRIIVQNCLMRSLHHVTNRQAIMVADSTFSRSGAVPGILDAVLVAGSNDKEYESVDQLKQAYKKENKKFVDVTRQLILEWERQVSQNGGSADLWPEKSWPKDGVTLGSLRIYDSFTGAKVLWIRYARSGDGERCSKAIKVGALGSLEKPATFPFLQMDPGPEDLDAAHMVITKEEFVTCFNNCALLSESIRRMTSADHASQMSVALSVDLNVINPEGDDDFADDFADLLDVGQTILLEVWDYSIKDIVSGDSFLGEVELPPLTELSGRPKDLALPLKDPAASAADDLVGKSREDKRKASAGGKITGVLYVNAHWQMPATEISQEAASLSQRAELEKQRRTGRLTLKVIKAENLRQKAATFGGLKNPEPYVCGYRRNDVTEKWEKDTMTGRDKTFFQTKTAKVNGITATWSEAITPVEFMTGSFEAKFKKMGLVGEVHITSRAREEAQRRKDIAAVAGGGGANTLSLKFRPADAQTQVDAIARAKSDPKNQTPEMQRQLQDQMDKMQKVIEQDNKEIHHKVPIFLGDTILDFKTKVEAACKQEGAYFDNVGNDKDTALMYRNVKSSHRHLVCVFVPPEKLRAMAQQVGKVSTPEYKNQYDLSLQDPSNWQPLNPLLTFRHYANMYGFGIKGSTPLLQMVEGTPSYALINSRFRQFQEEALGDKTTIQQLDDDQECYAYAMYRHAKDGGSVEWRPAIATPIRDTDPQASSKKESAQKEGSESSQKYQVCFLTNPKQVDDGADKNPKTPKGNKPEDLQQTEWTEDEILLGPQHPNASGAVATHPEHKKYLAEAKNLRDHGGMSEAKIVQTLNDRIEKDWKDKLKTVDSVDGETIKEGDGTILHKPPHITYAMVQRHLQQGDVATMDAADKKQKQAAAKAAAK